MYKDSTVNYISDTFLSLKNAHISVYKISQILDEPESTIHRILNPGKEKYSEERVLKILDRINKHLDSQSNDHDPVEDMINHAPEDPDLFIRLYALGLDSKAFTPDEKYKLAVAYKKLTDLKNKP